MRQRLWRNVSAFNGGSAAINGGVRHQRNGRNQCGGWLMASRHAAIMAVAGFGQRRVRLNGSAHGS